METLETIRDMGDCLDTNGALHGMLICMSEAFILSAVRTPLGSASPPVLWRRWRRLISRQSMLKPPNAPGAPERVEDVILAASHLLATRAPILPLAALSAGFPVSTPG